MFTLILIIAALVLFFLASLPRINSPFQLGWAGMFCLTLAYLISNWSALK